VLRIERASYAFPWTEGIFRDCLRVNYTCRVAEIGLVAVGYGILSVAAGEAHLLNLCVAEAYRCRGIGRRLLAHLLLAAGNAGAGEAFLEARPSNTSAIRLYQSLGISRRSACGAAIIRPATVAKMRSCSSAASIRIARLSPYDHHHSS
jgi:ribosomal-protein-alanine N-acetyltransferase